MKMLPENKYVVNAIGFQDYKADSHTYIVMELCDQSLYEQIQLNNGLNETQLMNLFQCLVGGFKLLHNFNIVHGDVKPHNILLRGNTYKLADFGLSMIENPNNRLRLASGTYSYCHPSVFKSRYWKQIGLKRPAADFTHPWCIDLYSIGVTLYESITCKKPFYTPDPAAMYNLVLNKGNNIRGTIICGRNFYLGTLPSTCFNKNEQVKQSIAGLIKKLLAHEENEMIAFAEFFEISVKICVKLFII